jgi:hypothetical protein
LGVVGLREFFERQPPEGLREAVQGCADRQICVRYVSLRTIGNAENSGMSNIQACRQADSPFFVPNLLRSPRGLLHFLVEG